MELTKMEKVIRELKDCDINLRKISQTEAAELWEAEGKFLFRSKVSGGKEVFQGWQALYKAAAASSWAGEQLRRLISIYEAQKEGIDPALWIKKTRRRMEDQLRKDINSVFLAYSVLKDA